MGGYIVLRGMFLTPLLLDSANEEPLFLESIWRPVPYDCKAVILPRVPLMPDLPAKQHLQRHTSETRLKRKHAWRMPRLRCDSSSFRCSQSRASGTSRLRLLSLTVAQGVFPSFLTLGFQSCFLLRSCFCLCLCFLPCATFFGGVNDYFAPVPFSIISY